MTTRNVAKIAERMSALSDEMVRVSSVLVSNRSRIPAQPHLSGLEREAKIVANILRGNFPLSDGALNLAENIDSWCETWREWRDLPTNNSVDASLSVGMEVGARFVAHRADMLRS